MSHVGSCQTTPPIEINIMYQTTFVVYLGNSYFMYPEGRRCGDIKEIVFNIVLSLEVVISLLNIVHVLLRYQ